MGCGCGGAKTTTSSGTAQTWRLTLPSGATTDYPSQVEADAANIRSGNTGTVARV